MGQYKSFFEKYYKHYEDIFLDVCVEDFGQNAQDYLDFACEPVKIDTNLYFHSLEESLKIKIPSNFIKFYSECYSFDEDFQIANIFLALPNRITQNDKLNEYIFDMELSKPILQNHLIPIGSFDMEWFICIQPNKTDSEVFLFDSSFSEEPLKAISKAWFSSFDKFILCLTSLLETKNTSLFNKIDPYNNFNNPYKTNNSFKLEL